MMAEPPPPTPSSSPEASGPAAREPIPARIGRYRVTEALGAGGMGVVYAAEDETLGRSVAIKRIHTGSDDTRSRERVLREARAAARVNHPNVCQVFEVGEENGRPFIVMERLEGEPLSERVRGDSLALEEAVRIATELLVALAVLHGRGLVHRDLKPSNVFLTPHGLKVLDFGLARVEPAAGDSEGLPHDATMAPPTLAGSVFGTPRYMAPEQLLGRSADARADLFAVGAILYEMLAGRPAFGEGNLAQTVHAILTRNPAPLGGSRAIEAVNRVVYRALAKEPADRYADAGAFARELQGVLLEPDAGAAVDARPVTRLLVLPFRLLRPDPEFEYLGASLAETVTDSLSRFGTLQVRSPLAGARHAEAGLDLARIAEEAGVDAVVTGALLRAGSEIRLTAQLLAVPDGTVLGSCTERVGVDDLFALEERMREKIVESLALASPNREPSGREVPANAEAYEFYLRGLRQRFGSEGWQVARDLFRQAVHADERYAPAWTQLARCDWLLGKYGMLAPEVSLRSAEEALARALALSPALPAAIRLRAQIDAYAGRGERALQDLLRLARERRSEPEVYAGLVQVLRFCGLLGASVAAHKQAVQLDPNIATSVAHTYFQLGEFERALAQADRDIGFLQAQLLTMMGRLDEARRMLRAAALSRHVGHVGDWILMLRAHLEEDPAECTAALARLERGFRDQEGMYYVARMRAHRGEVDRALDILGRLVVGQGYALAPSVSRDAWLRPLLGRPAFAEVLRRGDELRRRSALVYLAERGDELLGVGAD